MCYNVFMKGLDTTEGLTQETVNTLAGLGIKFCIKYCANTANYPAKRTSHAEAAMLHAAGIKCGFVYEGLSTTSAYFSDIRGTSDAKVATEYLQLLGVPSSVPVFFAVDYDAAPSDITGVITAYAKAFHDAVKATGRMVGVYGSGDVCKALKAAGLAHYTWLSNASGWSGYHAWVPMADIVQQTGSVAGLDSDPDTAQSLECFW